MFLEKQDFTFDFFTGNATTLDFFLISPDGDDEGDAPDEVAYSLDVTSSPGEWNIALISILVIS